MTAAWTWVIERDAFASEDRDLVEAARRAGHEVVVWKDDWWSDGRRPQLDDTQVVFHGSLGNAERLARERAWTPGVFCATPRFACSAWYEGAAPWLLHEQWRLTTVRALVDDPVEVGGPLAENGSVFVRPDSPLKPFSGRVCELANLSLEALDFGFYYEDEHLPVVVAPVRKVGREWRFVIVDREVVAGSGYLADGRRAREDGDDDAWRFARTVSADLNPPERVYVLDVAEVEGQLRLVELNPFSGADLYGCDAEAIVSAVTRARRQA